MKKSLAILLLAGCASWAPTERAGLRRMEYARFVRCIHERGNVCEMESHKRCGDLGLEAGCGTDEYFTSNWGKL